MRYRSLVCVFCVSLFFSLSWVSTTVMGNTEGRVGESAQSTSSSSATSHSSNNKQPTVEALAYADPERSQDAPRFYLQKIILQGAKFLGKRAKKRLLKPYLHQFVDATQINQLAQAIRAYYIGQGYPTTQVKVVTGQNLQAGELKIDIQLGFIEDIILNGHTARDKGKVATAFLRFKGRPLYLRYLDRGIDQLNSVPSSWATLRILSGLREGGSVVLIDQTVSKPVRINIGGDNLEQKKVGSWRWKYQLDLDNLLSINDVLTANYDINHAQVVKGKKLRVHHLMLKYSFPIGPFNVATTHNMGSSITPNGTKNYLILYTQHSYTQAYEVKFPLYKWGAYKGTMLVNLNYSTSENKVQDAPIAVQSQPATQGKLAMVHTGILLQGVYTFNLAYEQGLTWFGAGVDKVQPEPGVEASDMAKRQFKKVNFHGCWNRPFTLYKQSLYYQLTSAGQYSRDEIAGHQLALAGLEQVCGFIKSYNGNKGIYCKQEIGWKHLFSFTRWLYPLNVSVGLDIGYLSVWSNPEKDDRKPKKHKNDKDEKLPVTLASFAVGCQYLVGWLDIDFTYAQPLYRNKEWGTLNERGKVYISCNLHVHELIALLGGG